MSAHNRRMTEAERARKQKDVYLWASINKAKKNVKADIIEEYQKCFPAERAYQIADQVLRYKRIRNNSIIFNECMSDAGALYLYTICRCASAGYIHFENYFKYMMNIAVIWNWEIEREIALFCRNKGLKRVNVDTDHRI